MFSRTAVQVILLTLSCKFGVFHSSVDIVRNIVGLISPKSLVCFGFVYLFAFFKHQSV